MKTKLNAFFIIVLLMVASVIKAESKTSLRLNLQKGSTYEMTMVTNSNIDQEVMGQKMKIGQKMEMIFSYQVLDILPNKNFLIEYSILKIKMDMSMNGLEMNFESNSSDTGNPMNTALSGLVANKLKLEFNSKGQVERIEGLEEYVKKINEHPQMSQSMQMFTNEKSFKTFIGQIFNYFPETKITKGDKWTSSFSLPAMTNIETTMNFEVADITSNQIALKVTSDVNSEGPIEQMGVKMYVKLTGTQNGNMVLDQTDGWLRSSDLIQKFNMKLKTKNPQSGEDMEIPVISNTVTKITILKK
jgi:hypothetical protein